MNRHLHHPVQQRRRSQVFLKESASLRPLIAQLTNSSPAAGRLVLEIGPGAGILTGALLQAGFRVIAVEVDTRFVNYLQESFAEAIAQGQLSLVHQDVLSFELAQALSTQRFYAIVGNIPYHISTAIVLWALPHLSQLEGGMAIMVAREFAERVVAEVNTKNYGRLSICVQLQAVARIIGFVPRTAFRPAPKVDSAFLHFAAVQQIVEDRMQLERLTALAFGQRRKMLRVSLAPLLNTLSEAARAAFPVDLRLRPETLAPEVWAGLARWLARQGGL